MSKGDLGPTLEKLLNQLAIDGLPSGWTGGQVRRCSGGVLRREFMNQKRALRVEYEVETPGVTLFQVRKTDEDIWVHEDVVQTVNAKREPDKFRAAIRLMEMANVNEL